MKKIITLLLIVVSLSAFGQKKDTIATPTPVPITDSTELINWKDYQAFLSEIVPDLPAKYADPIRDWWVRRFQIAMSRKRKN